MVLWEKMIKAFLSCFVSFNRSESLSLIFIVFRLAYLLSPFQEEANEISDNFFLVRVSVSLRFNSIRSNETACKSDAFVKN